ncbi:MAG: glycerophosphodiester phosphodiesterase [Sphingomonadales bacterium]|nr:glycerophosphodiester phosphodiesterase [Sphingomonadales bacterium]
MIGKPKIIAHRGACGYFPEHTLEGYEKAIEFGADYIEPDLVITKDGHLVARHDAYLSTTTNVSDVPAFKGRKRFEPYMRRRDWFVHDFTLAELKSLRARQPFKGRSLDYDDAFEIPTFEEILSLARKKSVELGREVGVYPETKQPKFFEKRGLSFDDALLSLLAKYGYEGEGAFAYIQSFEDGILKRLAKRTKTPLIYLLKKRSVPKRKRQRILEGAAKYAMGVGPGKALLIDSKGHDTGFVAAAHALGLEVHAWTFRSDRLPKNAPNAADEYRMYFDIGVDALFSDFSDQALAARDLWLKGAESS